ncbi:MAG TPA: FAD-dependent oxidoreductase, partial [Sphingomonas sp.]|nr:FAD-dependent oxidoreductase [Sphingomonas sp.]
QVRLDVAVPAELPLVIHVGGQFYFKGESVGRVWLSPHDETPSIAHDVAPEDWDVATAIGRMQSVVDWPVAAVERKWAGLRSFAPDRKPVYGFDPAAPGLFWCAGQGGFGIQTSPAASAIAATMLLGSTPDAAVAHIDPEAYSIRRFRD